MNTIIYVRGGNIDNQIKECREYAIKQGYTIVGTTENETQLEQYILNNNIDYLLVSDVSRISRKRIEYLQIERMLEMFGVVIKSVEGQ